MPAEKRRDGILCFWTLLLWLLLFSACLMGRRTFALPVSSGPCAASSDEAGRYALAKKEGIFIADGNKQVLTGPGVVCFDRAALEGTVLDGWYYFDETGRLAPGSERLMRLTKLTNGSRVFDGLYMVSTLGRLSSSPKVRYLSGSYFGTELEGFYYFDENGRLTTEPGIHQLDMTSEGILFQGAYYFGGPGGVLEQKAGTTPEGLIVDENGRLAQAKDLGVGGLKEVLPEVIKDYPGEWSIYIRDLSGDADLLIGEGPQIAASLIKLFAMAVTYERMERVRENCAERMNAPADSDAVTQRIKSLLTAMITVSDNESYNELVRLQSREHSFEAGAMIMNVHLAAMGFTDTKCLHSLSPSPTSPVGIGDNNLTSARECGLLLERIYEGKCVSGEASKEMLSLLQAQKVRTKIPAGLPKEASCANKTGETTDNQHDAAIVTGTKRTYILAVLSSDCPQNSAVSNIRFLSGLVYTYMNGYTGE